MRNRFMYYLMIDCLFAGKLVIAQPPPPIDIPQWVKNSSLVVEGRSFQPSAVNGQYPTATVYIDNILKGQILGPRSKIDLADISGQSHILSGYGIFFFRRGKDGKLTWTTRRVSEILAAPPSFQIFQHTNNTMSDIASDLCSVFMIPSDLVVSHQLDIARNKSFVETPTGVDASGKVIYDMKPPTQDQFSEDVYERAFTALLSIPPAAKIGYLRAVIDRKGSKMGMAWAYAALLMSDDISRLFSLEGYLLRPNQAYDETNEELGNALDLVDFPAQYQIFFAHLVESSDWHIRQAAAYQLRNKNSAAVVSALKIALADKNYDVRKEALHAICSLSVVCGGIDPDQLMSSGDVSKFEKILDVWSSQATEE